MRPGKVYLIGAGPGDPGLITRKGLECLERADVIVYDRLLGEGLLDAARRTAEMIYVGKTSSDHTLPQPEINQLLVDKALEGKTVARLKGGDPFVLGRGGEEAETLVANGIPFEVVPGITSAVAVPAYAGIPVTHRGLASSFAVITGHEDPSKADSTIAWDKLATGVDTLVFLMGMQNLPEIAARLIQNGRASSTPVAVIRNGTRPDQQAITGTLADIVERVRAAGLGAPAVVVVGEVVRLRERLRWFDNRPLQGKRILVTRSRHQASGLSRLLSERGAIPLELPAIDIQSIGDTNEIDHAVERLGHYTWVVFTSVNGVEAIFGRLRVVGKDARVFHGVKVAAIGPVTAEALRAQGIAADLVPEKFTTEAIIAAFQTMGVSGTRILLPRADIADNIMAEALKMMGATVDEVNAYRTIPAAEAIAAARQKLAAGEVDIVTFTSSSTVTNLVGALGKGVKLNGALVACIGPKTAETAARAGLTVDILAVEHTIPGLVTAIEDYFVSGA